MPVYTFDTSVIIAFKVSGASQRMFLDALIAVTAGRAGATVVTNDWDDFKAIRYYCPVKLIRGSDFFR